MKESLFLNINGTKYNKNKVKVDLSVKKKRIKVSTFLRGILQKSDDDGNINCQSRCDQVASLYSASFLQQVKWRKDLL